MELNDFSNLSWEDMEHLVGELFEKKGYDVEVTTKTGDFGIDVWAEKDGTKTGIQVKHWNNDVGFDDVAKTLGSNLGKANRYIIISTKSGFTSHALEHQRQHSHLIELWDIHRFGQELERFNIIPNSIRHHPTMVGDEKTNFVHSSSIENNQKTNLQKTVKYGLGLTFLGLFLLIMAESISSAVFWGGLIFFIIGIILLIVPLFWKIAWWVSAKIESNTTSTYTLSKDESKRRKEKNELIKYLLIILVILIILGTGLI